MNSEKIYIDPRWDGAGGIGTFYNNINHINEYKKINIVGQPFNPVDCWNSSKALMKINDGVVFFPGYIPPLYSKVPFVFTIHDLNHLDRKENSSVSKKIFYNTVIKKGCSRAGYIFTVSEFSKTRIVEWSGVDADKVINVGNGVSPLFFPNGERVHLGFKYLLCVSNRKGHKNELGTLLGFKKAQIDPEIKIIFTGNPDGFIKNKIAELGLQERVVFTGYLEEEYLPKLYRSALGVVFVSFYEGFGLPVAEAQASGVPVLTSYGSSLEEIAGDAACLVDPNSTDEIAKGISDICNNISLRDSLVANGIINSRRFNWDETAKHVDTYLKKLMY
ncbi:glycosyltransferase family 4 protein [Erwinia sp. INIA-01]|uniref:glycosyltransferase family 4 protein n=1 Tax=Erwinia sp. INIA01 TaxID=2991500 RepID=UPI00222510D9|nr:glycosyltransferase family 1 protein [Erwinia sp. INIA01]MCW1874107.1 glycosyltransferase family 4 protein [Erwinia sp. INIA01]